MCKMLCARLRSSRPYRDAYKTHVYCSRCKDPESTGNRGDGVWMKIEDLINEKCQCCGYRPRFKRKGK